MKSASVSPDLERLAAFGVPGGPTLEEALALFAALRKTPHERTAIDRLMTLDSAARLPDPLLVALASALVDRGDQASAARVAARATSSPALVLRAELAASAGDLGAALALVERVLARDIDWPGARDRHTRWAEQLGVARPSAEPWATAAADLPDSPFELLGEVGRGGSGVVHEAIDRTLRRRVALKRYHRPDRDRVQLLHEARVAAALSGPGIVRVFDVDPDAGWLAMEWVPWGALSSLLRARRTELLSPIARWALPLAASLGRIHAAGWVHHDVKPANVLLRGPGAPLISDFGTARRTGEPSPPGSLGYVSPERLAGRPSDPRDDVYGFGRVLEDAIEASDEPSAGAWSALAAICTGPDEKRPAEGAALLARAALEARVVKE
jgi:eukaryotic-like serine/threonine-protein kinase